MSRLLEALRQLQQPAAAQSGPAPQKVTPRLAASIRKAVLGREPIVNAPVLFRMPDASPTAATATVVAPPAPPPDPTPQPVAPDPVRLVDAITASINAVQDEPRQAPAEVAKAPAPSAPQSPPRPDPTPGEFELAALLADPAQAGPFHDLLAAVERDTAGKQRPVVAIVGLDEQDATGLVAAALATLLAREPALLVEAHVHDRDIARRFGLAEAIGLCELLSGRSVRDRNILPTSESKLDVLPFGRATSSQAQLLPSALPGVLSQLKVQYAKTIVDAGPLQGSWAIAASRAADAVYLLVRLGSASAERAVETVARFRASGGKLNGCIALGGNS